MRVTLPLLALGVLCTAPVNAQESTYHVVARISLPGEGGWDYLTVDTAAHRLYVSRGTHVAVVDLDKDSVVGDIPNTLGVHGIALVRDLGRGYTSNGRDSTVTVFDLRTLAPVTSIKVTGRNPDAITYEPVSQRVFTFNGVSGNTTRIDPRTGVVVGTTDLGGAPQFAAPDGPGPIFWKIEDKGGGAAPHPRTLTGHKGWA